MMINNAIPQQQKKKNFATNWYDSVDEIFQLLISDAIWNKYGFESKDPPPNIENIRENKNSGMYLLDGDPIGAYRYNPEKPEWILYAKRY